MTNLFSNITLFEKEEFNPAFQSLLKTLDIDPNESFEHVLECTQRQWFQRGKERWEFKNLYEDKKDQILPFLKDLNCINEVFATKNFYDMAILHGSTLNTFRKRLQFLINEYNRGVRFKKIYVLTGDRPLIPNHESKSEIDDEKNPFLTFKKDFFPQNIEIKTEDEMIRYMLEQADMPEEMRAIPLSVICVPHINDNGAYRRARTEDTIIEWIQKEHPQGDVLAISNQPYIGYQHTILKYFLQNQPCETVGAQAAANLPISIHLDNITKWLYWEYKLYTRKTD